MRVGIERGGDTGQHHQCDKESQHGGAHAQGHAAVALQAVAHGDGVGYQCVGSHDAAEQQRGGGRIVQAHRGHGVGDGHGNECGEDSEDEKLAGVFLQSLHVHLQAGKEHNIVHAHFAEELEGVVAHQDVESVLAHEHTRQHHTYDMRYAQLAHDDGGKQDDAQHHKKHQCGVGDGEVGR